MLDILAARQKAELAMRGEVLDDAHVNTDGDVPWLDSMHIPHPRSGEG